MQQWQDAPQMSHPNAASWIRHFWQDPDTYRYFMTYDLQKALDEDDALPNHIPDGYEHLLRWPLQAFPLVSRGSLVDPNTKEKLKRLMQDAIDEDLYPNSDAYQLDALVERQLRVVAEGFDHWLTRVDTIEFPIYADEALAWFGDFPDKDGRKLGAVEFVLDCRDERTDIDAPPVAGLLLSYPFVHGEPRNEIHHTAIVRQILKWRVRIDADVQPAHLVALGGLKVQIYEANPMFLCGTGRFVFTNNEFSASHYSKTIFVNGLHVPSPLAEPKLVRYLVRNESQYEVTKECQVGQLLWSSARTKMRGANAMLARWLESTEQSYAPGGAGWQRARESFRAQQSGVRPAKMPRTRAFVGGVPNLARLKL